ncbi:sugar phosphate nucleotidyltransferase, partial [Poseidonibacter sp.]|uniref:sugar phosphate nucleotidyltransferase n=1 Tax=Poseidonibacter sp. TaxID=2321188 RepID=UPI003C7843A9
MKALLLAAGLGTRLHPITNSVPKCLVPINGKVLLEYWLENLLKVGITEILINTSYLSEDVNDYIIKSVYKD